MQKNDKKNHRQLNNTLSCVAPKVGQIIDDYLANICSDLERRRFDEHLEICSFCEKNVNRIEELFDLMRLYPEELFDEAIAYIDWHPKESGPGQDLDRPFLRGAGDFVEAKYGSLQVLDSLSTADRLNKQVARPSLSSYLNCVSSAFLRYATPIWALLPLLFIFGLVSVKITSYGPEKNQLETVTWHAGSFRYLDTMTGDLVTFVQGLPLPSSGGYGKLSSTRKANFNAFLDALFTAVDASLADGNTGDWCGVKTKAGAAGYDIRRFYDTVSGRWFVYGYDMTSFDQAYFFINPFAKRNIVIEVPHEPSDLGTGVQGVRLFRALAARALIINKEHRCSDPEASTCSATTTACSGSSGPVRESDVAHHTANTFYLLHVRHTDMDLATKFVQLHGFGASANDMVEIGDGTNNDHNPDSVSARFASNLRKYVPAPGAVHSCQECVGNPPSNFCGEKNVEGRYTNQPNTAARPPATDNPGGRFLHIDQALTLRDNSDSDGWYWGDIRDALLDTWPDCNMNDGLTDCTLGPQQSQYKGLTCPNAGGGVQ